MLKNDHKLFVSMVLQHYITFFSMFLLPFILKRRGVDKSKYNFIRN